MTTTAVNPAADPQDRQSYLKSLRSIDRVACVLFRMLDRIDLRQGERRRIYEKVLDRSSQNERGSREHDEEHGGDSDDHLRGIARTQFEPRSRAETFS